MTKLQELYHKLRGIHFLFLSAFRISRRILVGRTWNRILVDLEEKDGGRRHIWFARKTTGYSTESYKVGEPRE